MKMNRFWISVIGVYLLLLAAIVAFVRFDIHDATLKALGAFTGAFFAFLFIRVGEWLTRVYERQRTHYSALVKLEHILNKYLTYISDNVAAIDEISKIRQRTNGNPPMLSYTRLDTLPIDENILLDLVNIQLINELASYHVDIRKINDDIESINGLYDEIREAFVHHLISPEVYVSNFDGYVKKLNLVKAFFFCLNEATNRNLAIIRILARQRPIFNRFLGNIFSKYQTMPPSKEIDTELIRLQEEEQETRRKSRERNNRIREAVPN
jgi:hypothetical protein